MKRLFAVLLILMLLLAGCGAKEQAQTPGEQSSNQTEELMDAQALRAIAYEHAGVAEADVYDVEQEWEILPDKTLYKLDFDAKGVEYEYGLNGHTGVVVYSTYEGNPEENGSEELTPEQAKAIALEHAALTQEDVTGLRAEKDYDDRRYEVDFYADGYEYEYEIDLYTGDILKSEKERD